MSKLTLKSLTALAICLGLFMVAGPVGADSSIITDDNFVVDSSFEDPSGNGDGEPNGDADGTVANGSGSTNVRVGTESDDQTLSYSVGAVWQQMYSVLLQMIGIR